NDPVLMKMQRRHRLPHRVENALNRVDSDTRFEITQCPIGEDQAHVKTDQRATASEHEAHEPADRAVCLNPSTIINPNQREVLHIVKYFEQRNANENAGHDVVAVPPKRNARDEKDELYRIWSLPGDPHPDKICQKYACNCEGQRKRPLLYSSEKSGRNERSARGIIAVQCIRHSLR